MTDNVYRGEAILLSWGESSRDGRYVRLQLDEEAKSHPFKGLKCGPSGTRFAIIVKALADDQTIQTTDDVGGARQYRAQAVADPKPEKTKWQKLKPSAQAAIRCDDLEFHDFLVAEHGEVWDLALEALPRDGTAMDQAAVTVRKLCGVHSRRELDKNDSAALAWADIDRAYSAWLGTRRAQQQHDAYART